MREDIELLIELQEVDNKLFEIKMSRGDLPEWVRRITEEKNEMEEDIKKKKTQVAENNKTKKKLDLDVGGFQVKLKKYQEQLYSVTTNREYDAMTHEIDLTEKTINDSESGFLELELENERLTEEMESDKERLKELKSELNRKEKELQRMIKETEDEELKLNHRRGKIIVRLHNSLLNKYSRIKNAMRDGIAVAKISRSACECCFNTIPPQTIVEIRKHEELIVCEGCGRILV